MTQTSDSPVAIVTGGGNGIGAAICGRLAADGFRVVVADIDEPAATRVAEPINAIALRTDVSDLEANRALVAAALAHHGRLDLAVLNAGISSEQPPDLPLDLALYRRANGVNLDGVVFGIDAVTAALAEREGAIIVTASLAGLAPEMANPVYALAKSAAVGYVRAMAATLARRGIRINAICPSFADTAILGISGRLMRKQRFPLLRPDEVADAVRTVLGEATTGEVWSLVAGRPPTRFDFPPVPSTLREDGTEVEFRPFLAAR